MTRHRPPTRTRRPASRTRVLLGGALAALALSGVSGTQFADRADLAAGQHLPAVSVSADPITHVAQAAESLLARAVVHDAPTSADLADLEAAHEVVEPATRRGDVAHPPETSAVSGG